MFPAIPARNGLKMISRRNLLLGAAAGLAGGTGISYAHYYEPTRFEVTHSRIRFFPEPSTDTPLKVLFLTDLHYSRYVSLAMISQAIALGLAEKPDLILLGGDYVTFDMPLDFPAYSKVLAPLAACAPTFACYGNHDRPVGKPRNGYITKMLTDAGITILFNTSTRVNLRQRQFMLYGTGDLWCRQCHSEFISPWRDDGLPRLVLAHNPDSKDVLRKSDWDLMLCGHTHGGQMHIPLVGEPLAPVKDKRYVAGLNAFGKRHIYTSRGVGNLYGLRVNCRPEVTILELM